MEHLCLNWANWPPKYIFIGKCRNFKLKKRRRSSDETHSMTIGKRKSMGGSIVSVLLLSLFLLLFSVFNMSDFHDPSSEFGSSFSSNPQFFSLNLTLHNHHLLNSFQALFTRCSISCLFSFACFFFYIYTHKVTSPQL